MGQSGSFRNGNSSRKESGSLREALPVSSLQFSKSEETGKHLSRNFSNQEEYPETALFINTLRDKISITLFSSGLCDTTGSNTWSVFQSRYTGCVGYGWEL